MADISGLTKWALKNSKKFNISAVKLSWINTWLPGFFDYRIKLEIDKNIYTGRGIDLSENTAFDKALAEAFERAAVRSLDSPWATAAYPDYTGATERAYRELVCIDRVLCHHFCKIPFRKIPLKILSNVISIRKLSKILEENSLHLELCELRPVIDCVVVGAFIWSIKKSLIKGIVSGFRM